MNTSELARTFGITKDTIRYYREEGLIKPTRDEKNGYFDYSVDDIGILFHVISYRKRNNESLSGVRTYLSDEESDRGEDVRRTRKSIEKIDREIERLTSLRRQLELQARYRSSLVKDLGKIDFQPEVTGLYYLTADQFAENEKEVHTLMQMPPTYQGLVIPLDEFKDRTINVFHPQYAVGFTQSNWQRTDYFKSCDLKRYRYIPQGSAAIRFTVRLSSLQSVSSSIFRPVFDYASANHLNFTQPVTSIILRAVNEPADAFYIMFRFVVSE